MNVQKKVGTWEAVATLGCISLIPVLLTIPTYDVNSFGTATFLHNLYSSFITLFIIFVLLKLYHGYESYDILDICHLVGGKTLFLVCGLLLIIFLFFLSSLTLAEFTQDLQNVIFPDAPQEYISLFLGIAIIISLFLGIRGIFRTASFITPIITIALLTVFIILVKDVDFTNFTPLLGNNSNTFWIQGINRIGRFEGVFYFLLISPYVKNQVKVTYYSFLLSSLLILPTIFLLVGILPYPSVTENYFPVFELTRLITLGRFIQRVDSIFIFLWILATFVYLSFTIHFLIFYTQKLFHYQYTTRLIPLFTIDVIALSTIFVKTETTTPIRNFIFVHITPYMLCVIPMVILIMARIKRRWQCQKQIP